MKPWNPPSVAGGPGFSRVKGTVGRVGMVAVGAVSLLDEKFSNAIEEKFELGSRALAGWEAVAAGDEDCLDPSGLHPAFVDSSLRCFSYCVAKLGRAADRSVKGSFSMVADKNPIIAVLRPRIEV